MRSFFIFIIGWLSCSQLFATPNNYDIQYTNRNAKTVYLSEVYQEEDSNSLDDLYQVFSGSKDSKVDAKILCIKGMNPDVVFDKLEQLFKSLDSGLFEEHSLTATLNKEDLRYPFKLTLNDMPNGWEVGSVLAAFCPEQGK